MIEKKEKAQVDLFLFMGQSNMAGRGLVTKMRAQGVPPLIEGAGYEYRAVSAPGRLYAIVEPFGCCENRSDGIDDGNMKTGSLVTAFVNAYYEQTGVPVVGVSASKGGSAIAQWQPGGAFLTDAMGRFRDAVRYLDENGYELRHKYMLWCQGETDGDLGTSAEQYRKQFKRMLEEMKRAGVETCFLIRIGHYNGAGPQDYSEIMAAQDVLASVREDVVMVSTAFAEMKERGLMKDEFHYYQQAYNEVGAEAGRNTAYFVSKNYNSETKKEK